MKGINESISKYIFSAVIFTLIIVFLTVILTINLIKNNIRTAYSDHGLIVDIEPRIDKKLDKVSDLDGFNIKTNSVNITNNSDKEKKYQILLTPKSNYEDSIRVSLNKNFVRNLNNFNKVDNNYIIYEGVLKPGYSILHQIGMWQDEDSEEKLIDVNFKINIKIIDE